MKDILYFLHIPKTAGTSLNKFVKSKYPDNKVYPFATYHQVYTNKKLNLDDFNMIAGHFTYSFVQNMKRPVKIITVFRHPVSRTISAYNHFMREPVHNYEFNKFKKCEIKEALNFYPHLFSNQQTKHLGFSENILTMPRYKIPIPFSIENWLEFYKNIDMNIIYQNAIANLDKLFLFGFTDRMQDFMKHLCKSFNWKMPEDHAKHNTAKDNQVKEDEISENVIKKIEKLNEFDLKLYNYARQKYKEMNRKLNNAIN